MIKFFLNVIRLLFIVYYFRQVNTFLRVDHPFPNRMFARQRYSKHMCIGTCVHRITEHVKIMMTKTAIIFKINSMFFFKKSKILQGKCIDFSYAIIILPIKGISRDFQ